MASAGGDPRELIKLAVGSMNRGDLGAAETICRRILETVEMGDAHQLLGHITLRTARYSEAAAHCSRAISLGLRNWSNYLALGRCHRELGQLGLAHETLLTAAELNPGRADTAKLLLQVTLELYGYSHSKQLYEQLYAPQGVRELDETWLALAFASGELLLAPDAEFRIARQETALRWAAGAGVEAMTAGPVEQIPIEPVAPDHAAPASPMAASIHLASNQPYVVDLPDVQIFGYSHVVLTQDGYALNEAGGHADYGRLVDHRSDAAVVCQREDELLLRTGAFHADALDRAVMLCGPASDAFGHWVGEFVPRLEFLEQHPDFAGRPIIVDAGMPATHLELLRLACANPVITLQRGQSLRLERLLYAPAPTFFPIHVRPHDLPPYVIGPASVRSYRFLKTRVEVKLGVAPQTGRKVYLSRANSSWRVIRNEAEVRAYLESHGFETVMTEGLSFADQVRLFQSAQTLVGGIGSALQNFIFARPDVELYVLTQSNLHNLAAFNGQARALGYWPRFICGDPVGDPAQKHADFDVPIQALRAIVEG